MFGNNAVVGEGSYVDLDCDDLPIVLLEATWGRESQDVAAPTRDMCPNSDVLAVLQQECEGETHCRTWTTVASLGEPCEGIEKYLSYSYECGDEDIVKDVESETQTEVVCAYSRADLECDFPLVISIVSASFGRSDDSTCTEGVTVDDTCDADAALVFEDVCNDREQCELYVHPSRFTLDSTCASIGYATVEFQCV